MCTLLLLARKPTHGTEGTQLCCKLQVAAPPSHLHPARAQSPLQLVANHAVGQLGTPVAMAKIASQELVSQAVRGAAEVAPAVRHRADGDHPAERSTRVGSRGDEGWLGQ